MRPNRLHVLVVASVVGALACDAFAGDSDALTLARDGRTTYRIAIAQDAAPQVKAVAKDFQGIFREMTGAAVPMITDKQPMGPREIVIGPSRHLDELAMYIDWEELGDQGYVIRTHGPHLALFGGPREGTRNAVYTFLDEHLGCRFYSPEFSFIPKRSDLVIGITHVEEVPIFEARNVNVAQSADPLWVCRNRLNFVFRQARLWLTKEQLEEFSWEKYVHNPLVAGSWFIAGCPVPKPSKYRGPLDVHGEEEIHSLHKDMLLPSSLFEEHPDYFKYFNGERHWNHGMCPTSEGAFNVVVENAKAWLRREPFARIISISQADRYYACSCHRCLERYQQEKDKWVFTQSVKPDGSRTRPSNNRWTAGNAVEAGVFLEFVNRAADEIHKEFPDVYVHTFAYYWTRYPPDNWKPTDRIIIDYEFLIECGYHSLAQCEYNEEVNGLWTTLRRWTKKCPHVFIWDSCYGHSVQPAPVLKHRRLFYQELAMAGVDGIRVHMCGNTNQWLGELRAYIYAKLNWNPDYDVFAGIEEYCGHAYGAACEPMLQYVLETQDPANYDPPPMEKRRIKVPGYHDMGDVKPDVLSRWDELMEGAEAAAAHDPESLARVRVQHHRHNLYHEQRKKAQ